MADDDDPVVASYDVCVTSPSSSDAKNAPKLYLLQYPSHRKRSKPYNAARGEAPVSLRLKSEAGFVELDVPMFTHEHYSEVNGERFGKAMVDSRTVQAGGSYGLAGGFGTGTNPPRMRDIPMHDRSYAPPSLLNTQTLGGKVPKPGPRDPIYLIGSFHQNKIHLSHLDAVVQMRPQLHHIDAEEELSQKRFPGGTSAATSRPKTGLEASTPKVESKAIEIKIRDNKDDARDRNMNDNARQLRDIQVDQWQNHEWVDEDEEEVRAVVDARIRQATAGTSPVPKLQSSLSNGDWLDKMSAPREDGKKGLLAKLRGRERERARRKKAEEEKRQRQKEAAGNTTGTHGPLLDMREDSELSSPDMTDDEIVEEVAALGKKTGDNVQIKEEPAAPFPATKRGMLSNPPKKRGRPRKNPAAKQPLAKG